MNEYHTIGEKRSEGGEIAKTAFRNALLENLENTSRTLKHGTVDTSVSPQKRGLEMDPEEVRRKLGSNIGEVCDYIDTHFRDVIATPEDVGRKLDDIWKIVSGGLNDELKFREHEVTYGKRIAPGVELEAAMGLFHEDVLDWTRSVEAGEMKPEEFGARFEFALDNEIHPYADGCGKVTKAASAMFLRRFGKLPPKILSREEYYEAMNGQKGMTEDEQFDGFARYYATAFLRNNGQEVV